MEQMTDIIQKHAKIYLVEKESKLFKQTLIQAENKLQDLCSVEIDASVDEKVIEPKQCRVDTIKISLERDLLLESAPDCGDGFIRVPAVVKSTERKPQDECF